MADLYRIVIVGRLGRRFTTAIDPEMSQVEEGGFTTLTGGLIDQSRLIGIINHLHDLGILIRSFEVIDRQRWPK